MSLAFHHAHGLQTAVMLSASSPCTGARQECSTAHEANGEYARKEPLGPGIPRINEFLEGYMHTGIT